MKIKTTAFRNNYPAAIMILIILISSFSGSAQSLDGKFYQPIVPPYSWQSGWFKTNLNIPKSAATTGRDTGAIYYSPSTKKAKIYDGLTWMNGFGVDSVWKVSGGGTDTLKYSAFGNTYTVGTFSGSGGGSNFANANLTFTGNRDHDAGGYNLRISNADFISLSGASNNYIDIDESDPNSITLNALSNSSSKLHLVANNNIDYTAGGAHVFVDYVSALITARFHKDSITFPQIKNSVGLDSVLMVTASGKLKQIAKSSLGGGVAYTLINGATNLGSGSQVFKDTSSNKINLRSIVAGSGVTVTQNINDITIAATGGGSTDSTRFVTNTIFQTKIDSVLDRLFPNGAGDGVKVFAGVLYPTWNGSSNDWAFYRGGSGHAVLGYDSVSVSGNTLTIWHESIDSVVTCIVSTDEQLQKYDMTFGGSAGYSNVTIQGSLPEVATNFFLLPDFVAPSFTYNVGPYTIVYDTTNMNFTVDWSSTGEYALQQPHVYAGNYYSTEGVNNILQRRNNVSKYVQKFKYPVDASTGYFKPYYLCGNDDNFIIDYTYRAPLSFGGYQFPASSNIWIIEIVIDK